MTKFEPVRLAFTGCGAITRASLLPAALRSPLIEVAALVDVSPRNAAALRKEFGLQCTLATTLEDVIHSVDAVVVATPNHTHRAVAEVALRRGKPAFVEKPLTTTYADARALCAMAEEHNTFISVGYRSRHWAGVKMLKRLLDQDFCGPLCHFHYESGNTGSWGSVSGYSVDRARAGGGILMDAHAIDKILYWFGEPTQFTYRDDSHGGVEANCKAEFTFAGGAECFTGSVFLSRAIDLKNKIVVEGERCRCELEEKETASVVVYPRQNPDLRFAVSAAGKTGDPGKKDFQVQLEEFARNVRQPGELTVDGRFAARSVELIETMYRSRVALDEPWAFVNHAVA